MCGCRGHAWLLGGGMHGYQGACVVARGVCMVVGGVHGCGQGGHVWLPGGMHGCWGACMVARGHVWLLGGMHSCWGACVVAAGVGMHGWGGMCGCQGGMCRIRRDTVNERAVRILLECILV